MNTVDLNLCSLYKIRRIEMSRSIHHPPSPPVSLWVIIKGYDIHEKVPVELSDFTFLLRGHRAHIIMLIGWDGTIRARDNHISVLLLNTHSFYSLLMRAVKPAVGFVWLEFNARCSYEMMRRVATCFDLNAHLACVRLWLLCFSNLAKAVFRDARTTCSSAYPYLCW